MHASTNGLQNIADRNYTSTSMTNSNRQGVFKNALAIGVWSLWIDGVGGYRILEGDRFSIGGAGGEGLADIAVRSAWRRQMAILSRIGDDFWLQDTSSPEVAIPSSPLVLSDLAPERLPVAKTDSLAPSREPNLRAMKASPLSGTVVITLDPPHRFVIPVDAFVIADKTVLIGSERSNHIRIPRMNAGAAVMMKRGDQWWIRPAGEKPQPLITGHRTEVNDLVMTIQSADATCPGNENR
jgi:hypothetical protein